MPPGSTGRESAAADTGIWVTLRLCESRQAPTTRFVVPTPGPLRPSDVGAAADRVEQELVDAGLEPAEKIPDVDKQTASFPSDQPEKTQGAAHALDVPGNRIPVLTTVIAAAGVFLAHRRRRALTKTAPDAAFGATCSSSVAVGRDEGGRSSGRGPGGAGRRRSRGAGSWSGARPARGRWLRGRCVGVRYGPDGTDFVARRADGPSCGWTRPRGPVQPCRRLRSTRGRPNAPSKTRERPVREGRGVRSCGDPLRPACYGLTGRAGVKIAGTLHCCAGVPLQSNSWNSVPQLWFAQGTSRQRPDCGL